MRILLRLTVSRSDDAARRRGRAGGIASRSGQALAEFALVVPVFMLLLGGIIQFGVAFWAQNTLTQVVRDTGRWAATQQFTPTCDAAGPALVVTQANSIAGVSSLIGYTAGSWGSVGFNSTTPGVAVEFVREGAGTGTCPPPDNQTVWYVHIKAFSQIPLFFPLTNGLLSSEAKFRMEPKAAVQ